MSIARWMTITLLGLLTITTAATARDYVFDTVHTHVGFEVSHLGFSMSQGNFRGVSGGFSFNKNDWKRASCDVRIDVNSLDMGDAGWRKKLLGKKWFNVEQHPQMRFVCSKLEQTDDRHGELHGQLSLLGVSRPVVLDLSFNRAGIHKYSMQYIAGFSASTEIKRSDFGMTELIPDIGDSIKIHIEVEASRSKN